MVLEGAPSRVRPTITLEPRPYTTGPDGEQLVSVTSDELRNASTEWLEAFALQLLGTASTPGLSRGKLLTRIEGLAKEIIDI